MARKARAGEKDRRITIERATKSVDQFNESILTWSTLATVWAKKLDVKDAERIAAREMGAEITTRFEIYWSTTVADVNAKDRLRFDGKIYDIAAVKEVGRREGIEITASARADLEPATASA